MDFLLKGAAGELRSFPKGSPAGREANDNGGRRVTVRLKPAVRITVAEIEVFGSLLRTIEEGSTNDSQMKGEAA